MNLRPLYAGCMLVVLLLGAAPDVALAADLALAPSPAVACLTLPAGVPARPDYPDEALQVKDGGVVRVQLVFRGPDQKPEVKILRSATRDLFDEAVEKHVRQYRVPCMQPGDGPVTLLQEYAFDPDGRSRVMASATRDDADPARSEQMKCMRHKIANSQPVYPRESVLRDEQGTLLVKLVFTAPDQPPALEWVAATPYQRLRSAVREYALGLRLPCLRDGPVALIMAKKFVIVDGPRAVLKDGKLMELLGASKDLAKPVFFDLNTMACPFDLRISYYRPFAANTIEQLDTLNPARAPLLHWLAGMTLDLNEAQQLELYGSKLIVSVPCGKLKL